MSDYSSNGIQKVPDDELDTAFAGNTIDLVSKPLGSRIVAVSDEWFAAAENLTKVAAPIRRPGVFTHAGAWYDGWETRRHNPAKFDWVVFRLGVASGTLRGFEVDTAFFDGNHAPEVAVQAWSAPSGGGKAQLDEAEADRRLSDPAFDGWHTVLPRQTCGPNQRQAWRLQKGTPASTQAHYTHLRLQMFPDGGIARFRAFGVAVPLWAQSATAAELSEPIDLAAATNGGVALTCSDQHFGTAHNLLLPGRGVDMGDGWETRRSRGKHIDWVIVRLGAPGVIERLVIDTAHFRGNFPNEFQLFAGAFYVDDPEHDEGGWIEILGPAKARPDDEHVFCQDDLKQVADEVYTHVKLVIIPDGGVKRLRVFGTRMAQ